jgi:hypothetical protein
MVPDTQLLIYKAQYEYLKGAHLYTNANEHSGEVCSTLNESNPLDIL